MPLEAIPVDTVKEVVVPAPVALEPPLTTKPMTKVVDKVPITSKLRSYSIKAEQVVNLAFVFQNDAGEAFNLDGIDIKQFEVEVRESVSNGRRGFASVQYSTEEEDDQHNGKLKIRLTKKLTRLPGIYTMVVKLYDSVDRRRRNLVQTNDAMLYITGNIAQNMQGPPTLLEIRLQLRDSSPEENSLLDGFNFSDEEIAIATLRCIQYFNETDPNVGVYYTTNNFPSRYYLTEGIIGQLFRIVAEYHRKNNLQYQSGGLSVDDRNKEQNYAQAGEQHWALFVDWVKRQKVKINMAAGYGVVNSYYAYRY